MKGFAIDFSEHTGFLAPDHLFPALALAAREIGEPPRDSYTERVPFSSSTCHFEDFCGESYGERTLSYTYELLSFGGFPARQYAERVCAVLRQKLRWRGWKPLSDTAHPDFFFEARAPVISVKHPQNGVWQIVFTFTANPAMLPKYISSDLLIRLQDWKYPDLNADNAVTAADAALILAAAENIAAGLPSGLTAAQEVLADADRDGSITETDALLVQDYAAAVQAGDFADNPGNWYAWLHRFFRMKEAVY